jgi:hypothetical protein
MTAPGQLADAAALARKRGHLPLRQGRTFECPRCGSSGSVGPDGKQVGRLFTTDCGTPAGVSTC